jgi:diguanylate cyclase (GGDEF)-like protein
VAIRRSRAIKSVRPTLLIKRDGNEMYIESTASPIRDGSGAVSGGVLVFHDVSESRELNRKLSYHASHDILTGLVNRREFEARLERSLRSARARETSYALCHLDVDQFKIINDTCGHSAGDALLGQVGALLKTKIRWRDTLARLGGDEFGGAARELLARRRAAHGRAAARDHPQLQVRLGGAHLPLGCSIGVVPITGESEDVAALLSAADSACQAAKEAGRNRVYSFQENDIDLMRRRREMQWAARINNALEESRFELYRMTILPLQKPDPGAHYELLLRMKDEQGKIVSPDNFIKAAAERYGHHAGDRPLGDRERAALAGLRGGRARTPVDVLDQPVGAEPRRRQVPAVRDRPVPSQRHRRLEDLLRDHRDGGDRELLAGEPLHPGAQGTRLPFALDDFGTGLSSFGYLKHFPVDFLKIDGSFVKEILHDPIDREMVRSINEIGHLTGKLTIAEFAENDEIINMLRNLGVDYAQGYGVASPQRISKLAVNG